MIKELKTLTAKLDKIPEQQELILAALENKIVLDSNLSKKLPETERKSKMGMDIKEHIREMFALRPHKIKLQKQFNLKVQPHASRVKAYLKTKDPSIFDGLKRAN